MRKAAYLQVTRECNNECIFCSNPEIDNSITFEDAKRTTDMFISQGYNEIILTGGEPTRAGFICDLIRYIRKSADLKMISNGTITKKMAAQMHEAGLTDINISIHSLDEESARKLGSKNLKKTVDGIRFCLDVGMIVTLNITINSINCRELPTMVGKLIDMFDVKHFVFNNLDPGTPDGTTLSRAAKNSWIVAKFKDIEHPLTDTVKILKGRGRTFRIERVPLCYMRGFEEFSTETRKIVKDEAYVCSFIENKSTIVRKVKPKELRMKVDACSSCTLDGICAGTQKEYIDLYGDKELYPVFTDKNLIINRINHKENWNRIQKSGPKYTNDIYLKLLDMALKKVKGKKILDLGCGDGQASVMFRDRGLDVTGVDISRSIIKRDNKRYPDMRFVVMGGENLEFPDSSFDIVHDGGCLHVNEPKTRMKIAKEIDRVLKPGGYLISRAFCGKGILFKENDQTPVWGIASEMDTLFDFEDVFVKRVEGYADHPIQFMVMKK